MKKNRLGKTDLFVTPVGMGTLTMGFSQKNLSIEEGSGIILHAVRSGINFIDTAEYYDTYRFLRPALDIIRSDPSLDMPVISSKSLATGYDDMTRAVRDCLEKLEVPRIDIFLLHEVRGAADFDERREAWKALRDLKRKGLIRAIGISTHHADAAKRMVNEECDVVFALINRTGLGIRTCEPVPERPSPEDSVCIPDSVTDANCTVHPAGGPGAEVLPRGRAGVTVRVPGDSPPAAGFSDRPACRREMEQAIRLLDENGVGVFTMKAFGGGNLITDYQKCLEYASSVPGNSSVMIGMGSLREVDDAVSFFEGRLPRDYRPDVANKRMTIDQSDCEGCGTCIRRCVSGAIHRNSDGLAEIDPGKCVLCGYCAPVCPVRAIIFL